MNCVFCGGIGIESGYYSFLLCNICNIYFHELIDRQEFFLLNNIPHKIRIIYYKNINKIKILDENLNVIVSVPENLSIDILYKIVRKYIII